MTTFRVQTQAAQITRTSKEHHAFIQSYGALRRVMPVSHILMDVISHCVRIVGAAGEPPDQPP